MLGVYREVADGNGRVLLDLGIVVPQHPDQRPGVDFRFEFLP